MIVIDGKGIEIPGADVVSWLDRPDVVHQHKNVNRRGRSVRLIFIHTVEGKICKALKTGGKPSTRDLTWYRSNYRGKKASTDAYVDTDGSAVWANDPAKFYTWGVGSVNPFSIHIEMVQDEDGTLYEDTMITTGKIVVAICKALGIQCQTAWDFERDAPEAGRIVRLDPEHAGEFCTGVVGHRNAWTWPKIRNPATGKLVYDKTRHTSARGFGDPNDFLQVHLVKNLGFEKFDYQKEEDKLVWTTRQKDLGLTVCDGLPLKGTAAALAAKGYKDGMWISGKAAA